MEILLEVELMVVAVQLSGLIDVALEGLFYGPSAFVIPCSMNFYFAQL